MAALATGHPERFRGFMTWSTPTFEVTSAAPIELGLDGETMVMDSPLRFSIRPQPVRVRLPHHAIGYSPAARSIGWRESLRDLWGVTSGPAIPVRRLSRPGSIAPCPRCRHHPPNPPRNGSRARLAASPKPGEVDDRRRASRDRECRPSRVRSDREHPDADAGRTAAAPVRARQQLDALVRDRGRDLRSWGARAGAARPLPASRRSA